MTQREIVTAVTPVVVAALIDARTFLKARQEASAKGKPVPAWDWSIFVERLLYGGIAAAIALLGAGVSW